MDFGFTETQDDIRSLTSQILAAEISLERLKELESGDGGMDRRTWKHFAEANLLGLALPESVGGSGLGLMELCVMLEEAGRAVAPIPLLATVGLASLAIARFGSEEQRQAILPRVVTGDLVLSAAIDESANYDPRRPATTASQRGRSWVINGVKVAVPWACVAERLLVPASTGPDSVALFLVDPTRPGVHVEPAIATHREPQGILHLVDAVVSEDDMIGDASGVDSVRWLYETALACLCATGVGVLDEALRITVAYTSQRAVRPADRLVPGSGDAIGRHVHRCRSGSGLDMGRDLATGRGLGGQRRARHRQVLGCRRGPAGRVWLPAPPRRARSGCELSDTPLLPVGQVSGVDPRGCHKPADPPGNVTGGTAVSSNRTTGKARGTCSSI